MTTYFYDGQIRRYLLQIVRLLSNFAVRHSDGTLVRIPVMYADPDRQVAHIINQNSENTVQTAPMIAIYMSELELDTNRLSDSSYVGKVHIRERSFNEETQEYENNQGNSYTVERLMPTPYKLGIKVDIWSTSTDQKLQILEQILMLFNPSLEIQTTDNYIDWTSLTVVDLVSTNLSSRSVPVGAATEIDIATLTLSTPIWISPPAKLKRLGVVTAIISNIFNQQSEPYGDYAQGLGVDPQANDIAPITQLARFAENPGNYSLEVTVNIAKLLGFDIKYPNWKSIIEKYTGEYRAGLSRVYLRLASGSVVVGYFSINPLAEDQITINWDPDTYPGNSSIASDVRTSLGTIDAIIDPKKTGPRDSKLPPLVAGSRYLIIDNIGGGVQDSFISDGVSTRINTNVLHNKVNDHRIFVDGVEVGSGSSRMPDNIDTGNYYITLDAAAPEGSVISYQVLVNEDGPDAWKNSVPDSKGNYDFTAEENDVIEWDGSKWNVVFSADTNKDQLVYLTNIFTGTQFTWSGTGWSKTFEGVYRKGDWWLEL
jgi:uncharacterized protein (DUF736 family)